MSVFDSISAGNNITQKSSCNLFKVNNELYKICNQSYFGFLPPNYPQTPASNYPTLFGGINGNAVVDSTTAFVPGQWYSVAFTYVSGSGTGKIYVNGTNTATNTGISPLSGNEPLYWGTWEGFNWLQGGLGVMSVWGRALSAPEIQGYHNTHALPYVNIPAQKIGRAHV